MLVSVSHSSNIPGLRPQRSQVAGDEQAVRQPQADRTGQVDPEALSLIARQAIGSMRDAISLLDQLASAGDSITLQLAQDVLGTATSQAVINVVEAVINHQSAQGLDAIHRSLDSGSDPRQFARQIVDYLRSLLLVSVGNASQVEATAETRGQMAQHAQAFTVPELLRIVQVFNQAATETRSSWQPALPRGMGPKYFSFNIADGRCPICEGADLKKWRCSFFGCVHHLP